MNGFLVGLVSRIRGDESETAWAYLSHHPGDNQAEYLEGRHGEDWSYTIHDSKVMTEEQVDLTKIEIDSWAPSTELSQRMVAEL